MPEQRNARQLWWISAALAVITLAVFSPLWHCEFLVFDDQAYVTENPYVRSGLNANSLAWAFQTSTTGNWIPLTWISHILDVQFFGLNAGWHHLTNVLLHTANVVLLFLLLQRMTGAVGRSAVVAGLFAWHPAHVESVAWIAERKDVLSAFFLMLTVLAYVWHAAKPCMWRYVLALALFALALMAKPMVVTLPFLLLLLDYWPLRRCSMNFVGTVAADIGRERESSSPLPSPPQSCGGEGVGGPGDSENSDEHATRADGPPVFPRASLFRILLEKVPLVALSGIGCALAFWAQGRSHAVASAETLPFWHRLGHALVSYLNYIEMLAFPRGLAIFYPYPLHEDVALIMAGAGLLAIVSVLAVIEKRRRPYLSVGWLWFVVMLGPVIGIIQVGSQGLADRYTYLPSIGSFIMVVWGLAGIVSRYPFLKFLTPIVGMAMLAVTSVQIRYWKDTRTVFAHARAVTQNNYLAATMLGSIRAEEGDQNGAMDLYHEAIRDKPNYAEAHFFLARALEQQGKADQAALEYQTALRLNPYLQQAHLHFGVLLAGQKKVDAARAEYEAVLTLNPKSAAAHNDLARLLQTEGLLDESIAHYLAALGFDSSLAEAHNNLGVLYLQKGQTTEGATQLQEALRLNPGNVETKCNLATALLQKSQWQEAGGLLHDLSLTQPNNVLVQYQYGLALEHRGETREAMSQYARVLLLKPDFAEALDALAWIAATDARAELRNGAEAVGMAEKACAITKREQPAMLLTLAAAYAEAGRFQEAEAAAQECLDRAGAKKQKDFEMKVERVREAIRAGRPFRETAPLP